MASVGNEWMVGMVTCMRDMKGDEKWVSGDVIDM